MSKHPHIFTVLAVALLVAAAPALAGTLEEDLELMMTWFEGEFDNHLQYLEDEENPPEQPHEWIHSIFMRVDLPAFGDDVFYVEQYNDGDPSKIYRNRIYSYSLNETERAIQLTIYSPTDPKAVAGAHEDPSKLEGLTPETMRTIPGCEVFWKNENGERFIGYMKEGACRIDSRRLGKTIIIHDDLVLTPDEIWISDRAEDEHGNWVFGNRAGIHHKLKRSKNFNCWMTLKDEDSDDWNVVERGLVLHDQGGSAKIAAAGEGAPVYTLELEQRVYKGERQVEVLKLAVYRDEEEKSLAYSWSEPSSTNIGMNLRWFQAGCTAQ